MIWRGSQLLGQLITCLRQAVRSSAPEPSVAQLVSGSTGIGNENESGAPSREPASGADGLPVIVLGRRDGDWQATVPTAAGVWRSPLSSLEGTILLVKRRFFPRSGVVLAHAAYRDAFLPDRARLKIEPDTDLDRHSLQVLIDAAALPWLLDLADARIWDTDLSRATIERDWNDSPDVSGRAPPLWKSGGGGGTGGLNLFGIDLTDAWLSGVDLLGADLRTAKLGKIDLTAAKLTSSNASGANLEEASIHHTSFDGASLRSTSFRGATLLNVSFLGSNLTWADLRAARFFDGTRFDGADLSEAHLEGVNLYPLAAGALRGAFWATAYLDRTRLRREQLGGCVGEEVVAARNQWRGRNRRGGDASRVETDAKPWLTFWDARESYLNLKNNFNSIGRYADASWAYRRERTMERMALGHEWRTHGARRWRSFMQWCGNWLVCALTGYGESPLRPVAFAAAVIAVFWGGFYWLGGVGYMPEAENRVERLGCWDSLAYSAGAFFTVGFSDFAPLSYPARVLTVFESSLGILLVALLLYCLGNRISRS